MNQNLFLESGMLKLEMYESKCFDDKALNLAMVFLHFRQSIWFRGRLTGLSAPSWSYDTRHYHDIRLCVSSQGLRTLGGALLKM